MSDDRCRYAGATSARVLVGRHRRDCESAGCEGCEPCQRDHCRCGRHLLAHEPLTCAKCVGKVRGRIKRIRDLCSLAPIAATEGGPNTAVVDLAGPIPEHSTHVARKQWAIGGALCRCEVCPDAGPDPLGPICDPDVKKPCKHHVCRRLRYEPTCPGLVSWLENADGPDLERHPLWVLGSWDMLVTEHLGHDRRDKVTIPTAAAYLDANLTYLAQDRDFAFDELDREVRACFEHVERVLLVAEYVQRGAPCEKCGEVMERVYAKGATDDAADVWVCSGHDCDAELTIGDYDTTVYKRWLAKATRLTTAQILAQYRVPESTTRRWANGWTDGSGVWHEPTVRKHGFDGTGRQLYDVADVKAQREGEATPSPQCA